MKLENGHHITIDDATDEQYHKFCKKIQDQGFSKGEYGCDNWRRCNHVGIWNGEIQHFVDSYSDTYPHKLLTIEQALSEDEETMTKCRIIEIEEKPTFKPFKLEVMIETEDDLINLWHRVNVSRTFFANYNHGSDIKEITDINSNIEDDVYLLLDEKVIELGLRNE